MRYLNTTEPLSRGGRYRLPAFRLKGVLALVGLAVGFEWIVVSSLAVRLPGARRLAHGRMIIDFTVNLEGDCVLLFAFEALSSHVKV